MTRELLKNDLKTASSAAAVERFLDTSISLYGWEETERLFQEVSQNSNNFS